MTLTSDRQPDAEATLADRRRPGRRDDVSPELIPLLRTSEMSPLLDEEMALEDEDQLAGMRGIAAGLACSIPLWVGLAYVGRWLLT